MQLQTGVVCFRGLSGDFLDDEEPIFEDFDDDIENTDTECTFNPFDDFINYVASKMSEEGRV